MCLVIIVNLFDDFIIVFSMGLFLSSFTEWLRFLVFRVVFVMCSLSASMALYMCWLVLSYYSFTELSFWFLFESQTFYLILGHDLMYSIDDMNVFRPLCG